jgi:hypothetical protein
MLVLLVLLFVAHITPRALSNSPVDYTLHTALVFFITVTFIKFVQQMRLLDFLHDEHQMGVLLLVKLQSTTNHNS